MSWIESGVATLKICEAILHSELPGNVVVMSRHRRCNVVDQFWCRDIASILLNYDVATLSFDVATLLIYCRGIELIL